jgi:hypothetical protein
LPGRGLTEVIAGHSVAFDIWVELRFGKHQTCSLFLHPLPGRGLTEVIAGHSVAFDIELNSGSENTSDRLPFPLSPLGERAGVRG